MSQRAMTTTTTRFGDLELEELLLEVPLVWEDEPDARTIEVFARVIAREGGESLPLLVFLQGGPGVNAPRPGFAPRQPAWLDAALAEHRVVMLDQRGTGRSTPIGEDDLAMGDEVLAERLTHLRADSIVRDCEAVREALGAERWSILGQSFGGFTTLRYLSVAAGSLERVLITGGLSAVDRHADDVYALCYDKCRTMSERYWRRFPDDRDAFRRLVDRAREGRIELPSGEVVSESRLRSLGHILGGDHGWQQLHWLLELDPRSNAFRHDLAGLFPFGGRNPLYYVIHESSYADGCATRWSAERTEPSDFREDPTLLTGEHVRREWLDTVPELVPWKGVAERIAEVEWPKLYDREAIRASGVAGAASVYVHDLFVPFEFCMETAELLPNVELLITSEHEHSGLRTSGTRVLERLVELSRGRSFR